jgi:hypothetical protein
MKWLAWLVVTGLVIYYISAEVIHLYGEYALATASATAKVYEIDDQGVDDDTGQPLPKYALYRFQIDGKKYSGKTDNHLGVGDKLVVRYNPAHPDQNRDSAESVPATETISSFLGWIVIVAALYYWLKWILKTEKKQAA